MRADRRLARPGLKEAAQPHPVQRVGRHSGCRRSSRVQESRFKGYDGMVLRKHHAINYGPVLAQRAPMMLPWTPGMLLLRSADRRFEALLLK